MGFSIPLLSLPFFFFGNIFYSVVAENSPNRRKTPQLSIKIAQKLLTTKTPDFKLQGREKGERLFLGF
jgi:hypothetical protein